MSPDEKIREQKASAAVAEDVSEGVEEQVAGEIRNRQDVVGADPNEARLAAAMGYVDLAAACLLGIGGDKERIRRRDEVSRLSIKFRTRFNFSREWDAGIADKGEVARLDIARTISITLHNPEVETTLRRSGNHPIETIAAAGMQFNAQQPNRITIAHSRIGRIAGVA